MDTPKTVNILIRRFSTITSNAAVFFVYFQNALTTIGDVNSLKNRFQLIISASTEQRLFRIDSLHVQIKNFDKYTK